MFWELVNETRFVVEPGLNIIRNTQRIELAGQWNYIYVLVECMYSISEK